MKLRAIVVVGLLGLVACGGETVGEEPTEPTTVASTATTSVATTSMPSSVATTATTTSLPPVTVWVPDPDGPALLVPDIQRRLAHDPGAFTQGLAFRDGLFYESTGQYGESTVRIVDAATGEIVRSRALDDRYFGEGLEVVDGRIVQLTWREEIAFIWDAQTLEPLGTYPYEGEGWGLCARQGTFVMSDGSSVLTLRDLDTFEPVGTMDVRFRGEAVPFLNELECTDRWIYANVWQSNIIVVIDPDTGVVRARVSAAELASQLSSTEGIDVLNGIAHDPEANLYYLTGKYWPEIFEVVLVAAD